MSDDLVKRLREDQPVTQDMVSTMQSELQNEAADRIEELEAENRHLRIMLDSYGRLSTHKARLTGTGGTKR